MKMFIFLKNVLAQGCNLLLYYKNINFNSNIKQSFLFGLILNKLNIDLNNLPISDENSHFNFALGIFILSLICLLCFMNVVGYLTSIILIRKYDIETKFPKLKTIIRYFENGSLIFIIIEGTLCLIILIYIVVISLLEITTF
jgi:hypothetical protein